jgi:prepilin-type N-terminal cleavage/methylation domain-containing protein
MRETQGPFHRAVCNGFTLVELLVVIVILSILASLTLSGLNVGRNRAKIDKTASTIRKINEYVMEQYENYPNLLSGTTATALGNLRLRIVEEMPDNWEDVKKTVTACSTGAGRSYVRYWASYTPTPAYAGSECLYMVVARSGIAPDSLENFRPDEIGDADKDGAKEFLDGWGSPISFLRWAPGFSSPLSPIQFADPIKYHDPCDPFERDGTAFAMYPLIFSPGPDEAGNAGLAGSNGYGLNTLKLAWPTTAAAISADICLAGTVISGTTVLVGSPNPSNQPIDAYKDNISNHTLSIRGR